MDTTPLIRSSLHQQVATRLRKHITADLRAGDRVEAEPALAKRFGVSTRTIREAITTFAHEGLVERRPGRGTYVLDRTAQKHVAVIIGVHPDHKREGQFVLRLANYFYHFFAHEKIAMRPYWAPAHLPAAARDVSLEEFQRAVARNEVAGIVVLKGPLDERWKTALAQAGAPMVGEETPYEVGTDSMDFLREAIRYLVAHGRRRIGLLVWRDPEAQRACPWLTDVVPQFQELVRQAGGESRPGWIGHDLHPLTVGSGYSLFRELWLAHPEKPDGLVITDDTSYTDFATAALEMRIRVPAELLVVTHANKDSGVLYPFPTARLEIDPDEVGAELGRLALRLMRKEPVPTGIRKISFQWVGSDVTDAGAGSPRPASQERQVTNSVTEQ